MRKVLLLSLSLALGFSAFAQQRVAKNDIQSFKVNKDKGAALGKENITPTAANFAPQTAKSVVVNRYDDVEDVEAMYTLYDLQSNSWVSNRMYQLENGSVAVAATMAHLSNFSDRGSGYNFYKDGEWDEQPEARIEDVRTGWPSIARWGEKGEILVCHSPLRCYTREIAGEGEWEYRGDLPPYPEGYPYADDGDDWAWPRIATSGPNHNIIHVIGDIQHTISSDEVEHYQVYLRSEDAENWTISYSPLAQDGEEKNYAADAYNITANGHNVAMIYGDDLQAHVVMYKSTDDGETWTRYVIWENPYYGYDWESDENSLYTDTVFGPASLAIAIDNHGVSHVAMTVYEYIHEELGNTYTTFSGRAVDGVYYWNDTQGTIQDTYHPEYLGTSLEEHFYNPNPHHALRMWWPSLDDETGLPDGYLHMVPDSTKWIGYIPMYFDENNQLIQYDNDKFFHGNDYFYKIRSGQSGWPALSIDPLGNMACAFSAPNTSREESNTTNYLRSIYVSYRNVAEGYWHQVEDDITDVEISFTNIINENIFTNGVDNTAIPGEFWFSFQADPILGVYVTGNDQTETSQNDIHVVKVIANPEFVSVPENYEAKDAVYSIYPNPATDYVVVKSSENVEANISIVNLVGQTVKQFNKSLKMGENTISIDLKSGIYFCTISANGFNKTIKFVVK